MLDVAGDLKGRSFTKMADWSRSELETVLDLADELKLDPYDGARVQGHRLTLPSTEHMRDALASLPLEERREVTGLHPDRAPTIVAGATILIEVMRVFGLDSVEVSERDLLEGAAIETAADATKAP